MFLLFPKMMKNRFSVSELARFDRAGLALCLLGVFFVAFGCLMISHEAIAADGRTKSVSPLDEKNPLSNLWSGFYYAKKETKAMQLDDFANPGSFYVKEGAELWKKKVGPSGKSCASCHKDASVSMKEAGVRYPVYFPPLDRLINLEQRINLCRQDFQKEKKFEYETRDLLALTAFVRAQSRGMPVRVKITGPAKQYYEKGKAFYYKRRGQLDMSCAHCHENNYGKLLRSNLLSQGHANGFPTYRLKWQKLGSLHRRFRGCNRQVRAKPYAYGSEAYVNLELYLNWRGSGLEVETPAVRN